MNYHEQCPQGGADWLGGPYDLKWLVIVIGRGVSPAAANKRTFLETERASYAFEQLGVIYARHALAYHVPLGGHYCNWGGGARAGEDRKKWAGR